MSIIETRDLSFRYDEEGGLALDGVNIAIEEGSFTAVLGHNGSGKSTLAKHLNAILLPSGGTVYVGGMDTREEDKLFSIRETAGMVFQNPDNQIVATIVEEDVAFGCENLGIPSAEIRRRVDEALEAVGMTKYARHQSYALSGGQKQRIAIAGTIAMRRKCIIFDESTAMLDPMGRREVMQIIEKLNREEGITVITITHYMNEAALADRIIVMNDGKIIGDGTPSEVFSDPEKMWNAGLDVPQTTELLYKLRKAGLDVPLDVFDPVECAAVIQKAMDRAVRQKERV